MKDIYQLRRTDKIGEILTRVRQLLRLNILTKREEQQWKDYEKQLKEKLQTTYEGREKTRKKAWKIQTTYLGAKISKSEFDTLMELEEEFEQPIYKRSVLKLGEVGFKTDGNHVVSLSLYRNFDLSRKYKKCMTALPDSLGNLRNLQKLQLYIITLEYLPESFTDLTDLQELSSQQSSLTSLPELFGNLTRLQTLDL